MEWVFLQMNKRNLVALGLILMMLFAISAGVTATDSLDDLKGQRDAIQDQMNNTTDELNNIRGQQQTTQEQLTSLESTLSTLEAEIADLEVQLADAKAQQEAQQQEYDAIMQRLEDSQDHMQTRVSRIYTNGEISMWDIIFNSESFSDLISNYHYYEKIVEQDQAIIDEIKENKRLAKEKLDELERIANSIQTLTDSKIAQEAEYSAQADQKAALIQELETQADELQKAIDQFAADSATIEAKINALSSTSTIVYNGDGQFGWPVAGSYSVSSPYGPRVHPITNKQSFHTGIDIPAGTGTAVLSSEVGEVVFVGSMAAYGNCILVNHGGGYSTFYAHLSSFAVSTGASVERGQKIGGVGSTGWSTGPHLHYEIRINGSHVNPAGYL